MKVFILVFSMLFFGDLAEAQPFSVTTYLVNPCFCRTSSSQNGGGVLSCVVSGGSGNQIINWYNGAGIVFSNNTLVAGLNAGTYVVEVIDAPIAAYFIDTIKLDSVNPVAAFNVNSNALIDLGNDQYQGHISVDIEFENVSQNFAIPNFAPSDTMFYWNFDVDGPMSSWDFKAEVTPENRTFGPGTYKIGLATENYNGCKDTTYAQITVEETASIQSILEEEFLLIPSFDQKTLSIIGSNVDSDLKMDIYNLQGQLLKSIPNLSSKASIPFDYPKGIYLYQISDGQEIHLSRKFQF